MQCSRTIDAGLTLFAILDLWIYVRCQTAKINMAKTTQGRRAFEKVQIFTSVTSWCWVQPKQDAVMTTICSCERIAVVRGFCGYLDLRCWFDFHYFERFVILRGLSCMWNSLQQFRLAGVVLWWWDVRQTFHFGECRVAKRCAVPTGNL